MAEVQQPVRAGLGGAITTAWRAARFDERAYTAVRDDPGANVYAFVMAAVSILLAAVGGWLWVSVKFDGFDGDRVILRMVVLGGLFTYAMWLVWGLVVETVLTQAYRVPVDRMTLVRCTGFATAPAALMLLMLLQVLSLGVALVAMAAWFAANEHAIRAAVPAAPAGATTMANLAGFAVFALVLSLLGDAFGMGAGPFVHVGFWESVRLDPSALF